MKKLGFLLLGFINNYNFTIITSCAYALSLNHPYVNPSLIVLFQIIPGFLTQLTYPYILYKIPYTFRWIFLLVTQLIASLILIFNTNIVLLLMSVSIISINSYFGESSLLSLSSYYKKSELSLWIIGTGMAGIGGSGLYFALNRLISEQVIFIINLFIYYIFFCLGIYFLDYKKQIQAYQIEKEYENYNRPSLQFKDEEKIQEKTDIIPLENEQLNEPKLYSLKNENGLEEMVEIPMDDYNIKPKETIPISEFRLDVDEKTPTIKEALIESPLWNLYEIFLSSSCLCLAYFFGYLVRFAYVPLLFKSDFEYQLTQFVTQTGIFIGRTSGNYIKMERIKLFNLIHLYSSVLVIIGTILISTQTYIYPVIIDILLFIMYFNNGLAYPFVYQYLYKKYEDNKEWTMGAVGQYTSFFMILGCVSGYILQMIMN
jgi:hypothetical protein